MSETTATPAAPVAPATPPAATPVAPAPATVTLTKEQHDQLVRDSARAAGNQRKADLYDQKFSKKGQGHFQPTAPATPPTKEEMEAHASEEDKKAERGLMAIAADPAFREVLDADPTLRDLLLKNPLAVLPVFANDAVDAEDAISLVKDALNGRKKAPASPANPATPPVTPPAPPAGGVNPPGDQATNEAVEAAKKNPNTERAIGGMIAAKIRGVKK